MSDTQNELQNPKSGRPYTRRNVMKMGACALGLMALGGAGAFAYFTGNDEVANKTSVAQNLNVKVDEPHWTAGEGSVDILPGQTVAKDPSVVNLSETIPGYLFAEVQIPRAEVVVADKDGVRGEQVLQDLFIIDEPAEGSNWVLLEDFVRENDNTHVIRYVWADVVAPEDKTATPLFENVTLVNLVDKQEQSGLKMITVVGYGIQAEPFTNPGDAWEAYKKQNGIETPEEELPEGVFKGDVVLNTNFIELGEVYALAQAVTMTRSLDGMAVGEVVKTAECVQEGVVTFKDAKLVEGETYLMLPNTEGVSIDDAVKSFDTDIDTLTNFRETGQLVYEVNKIAFAVFSRDDNSLCFYNRRIVPDVGTEFFGKSVDGLFIDIEAVNLSRGGQPWIELRDFIYSVKAIDVIAPRSMKCWFSGFTHCTDFDLTNIHTYRCVSMYKCFSECTDIVSLDLSHWYTPCVETFNYMFERCANLVDLQLGHFAPQCSSTMAFMFTECGYQSYNSMSGLDLSLFDTTNVINMESMFDGCSYLWQIDLTSFDTHKVSNVINMFRACTTLKFIFVSETWDLTHIDKSIPIFTNCNNLMGGLWTQYGYNLRTVEYARIDEGSDKPGLLGTKNQPHQP